MIRPVHVIASFDTVGRVIPLYFRLSLEKEAPTYKVTVHNATEEYGRYTATYYCSTTHAGKEVELQLIFSAHSHSWNMSISNSRAHTLK